MSASEDKNPEEKPPKKESPMGFIVSLAVLSLVAVGAGWFVTGQLNPSVMMANETTENQKVEEDENKEDDKLNKESGEDEGHEVMAKSDVLLLDPIIIALHKSENTFMRIELAVIPESDSDIDTQEIRLRIGSDIAAFAQTLTLEQISGPSGYIHFREDILDRVRLITNGKTKDVLIMSLVAE